MNQQRYLRKHFLIALDIDQYQNHWNDTDMLFHDMAQLN